MAGNNIERLREHLFAELEDLRNPDKKHEKERTRAVVEVAQTIINSVKAETNFYNAVGVARSSFIPEAPREPAGRSLPAARKADDPPPDAGWMK